MKILVTGGAGFIGSHFARSMSGDYAITVLDSLTYAGNLANLAKSSGRVRFVEGDIRDGHLVGSLMAGMDVVVHFAAETHVDRSIENATDFIQTNVEGTQILLDAALRQGVGRFVHVSTDEVYGSIDVGSWKETNILEPNSPYAASKAASDHMVRAYHRTYGLPTVTTRCSNNYGPHQYPEKVIPLFITNLLDGKKVPLYGDGSNVRDWLHVDDHCQGIWLAALYGEAGEVYNIGGGTELTNRELTEYILKACGADWESVEHVPDRKGHDRRYSVDITKMRSLGYAPRMDFPLGLAQTVDWYRDNRTWWEPLKCNG